MNGDLILKITCMLYPEFVNVKMMEEIMKERDLDMDML